MVQKERTSDLSFHPWADSSELEHDTRELSGLSPVMTHSPPQWERDNPETADSGVTSAPELIAGSPNLTAPTSLTTP